MMTTDWVAFGAKRTCGELWPPQLTASSSARRAEAVLCSIQRRAEALGRHADNYNICASPGRNDAMKKLAFILVAAIAAFFSAADYDRQRVRSGQRQRHGFSHYRRQARLRTRPNDHCRRSPGSGRSAGRALRPSSAGGRLYAPDGNQLAAVCRPVHTQELEL